MKYEFESREKQSLYISKFIRRYTDVPLVCQFCNNEGKVHNNYIGDPYKIQLVCVKCRCNKKSRVDNMYEEIPLINLKEHIDSGKIKFLYLNDDVVQKIQSLLSTTLTKGKALESIGLGSTYTFNRLLTEYEKYYDKDIRTKLKDVFRKNRCVKAKEISIGRESKSSKNNIAKIKLEKGMSNRDIQQFIFKKHNVVVSTISDISSGRTRKPIPRTICYIAEALGVGVGDLFDEYRPLNIKNYSEYLKLCDKIRKRIGVLYKGKTHRFIAEDLGLTENVTFSLFNKQHDLSFKNAIKIMKKVGMLCQ